MAKLSDYFNAKNVNEQLRKEVCANCRHIYRPFQDEPFQANLSSFVWCNKRNENIEFINNNSCREFEIFIR